MIIDMTLTDTRPGATGPHSLLAPPAGFQGDAKAYRQWLRDLFHNNLQYTQVLWEMARNRRRSDGYPMAFTGPYADEVQSILDKIASDQAKVAAQFHAGSA